VTTSSSSKASPAVRSGASFSLADYVRVKGASFKDGLLQIDLVREVPDAMKPRRIAIKSGNAAAESQQIEHKNAA
jgi:molecular chaperone IbpA